MVSTSGLWKDYDLLPFVYHTGRRDAACSGRATQGIIWTFHMKEDLRSESRDLISIQPRNTRSAVVKVHPHQALR
jgi:hypothetical protein